MLYPRNSKCPQLFLIQGFYLLLDSLLENKIFSFLIVHWEYFFFEGIFINSEIEFFYDNSYVSDIIWYVQVFFQKSKLK